MRVLAENTGLVDDVFPSLEERDIHPEKAPTFENLILSLIPKVGDL